MGAGTGRMYMGMGGNGTLSSCNSLTLMQFSETLTCNTSFFRHILEHFTDSKQFTRCFTTDTIVVIIIIIDESTADRLQKTRTADKHQF